MSDILLDDVPSLSGELLVPLPGTWVAEVTAQGDGRAFRPGDVVKLTLLGKSRVGTVTSGGAPDLRNVVRIKGGANGLKKNLTPTNYQGRDLAYVTADVLRSAGEKVGDLKALRSVSLLDWIRAAEPGYSAVRRLSRLIPPGTFLRTVPNTADPTLPDEWTAVTPSWKAEGPPADSFRITTWPSDDGMPFFGTPDFVPEPGTGVTVSGGVRMIDRVLFTWEEEETRSVVWFRTDPLEPRDRMRSAMAKVFREVMEEDGGADFGRLYAGRIAKDMPPGAKKAEVIFEDDRNRLQYLPSVRVRTEVGDQLRYKKGSRVLVGWDFGDERFPFVLSASWGGGGGLIDRTSSYSGTYALDGPAVSLTGSPPAGAALLSVAGDVSLYHEHGGGDPPVVASLGGAATLLSGHDLMCSVQFVLGSSLPPATPLFRVTFSRAYVGAPIGLAQITAPIGAALGAVFDPAGVTVSSGAFPIPLPPGTYTATVRSGV